MFYTFFVFLDTFKLSVKLVWKFFNDKMVILIRPPMKNCRDFIRHIKFEITNTVCRTSLFTCVMTMITDFSIIFIFKNLILQIQHSFTFSCDSNSFLVNGIIFFFSKSIIYWWKSINWFLDVLLKFHKTFTYSLFHDIKYVFLLCDQIPKLLTLNIHNEYGHLFL